MPMIDEKRNISNTGVIQNLLLENREKLSISGVKDDEVVITETDLGLLTIKGENLKINKLSLDTSEVIIEGQIAFMSYSDSNGHKSGGGSLLGKLFK